MVTTKIQIKPHLLEYVSAKFGSENSPVRFPDQTDLYHIIWDLTIRRPIVCKPDAGNLEIILPDRREGKSPVTYNYLSHRSQKIIERRIENMFYAELHDYVIEQRHRYGVSFIEAIYRFKCRYGIDAISEDGLKKNCYRWFNRIRTRKKRAYNRH